MAKLFDIIKWFIPEYVIYRIIMLNKINGKND